MWPKREAENPGKPRLSLAGAQIQETTGFQNVGTAVKHSRPEDEEEAESLETHSCLYDRIKRGLELFICFRM